MSSQPMAEEALSSDGLVSAGEVVEVGSPAFPTFYAQWYPRLAAQLFAYLGDAEEAADIAQEAFLRAWRRWDRIGRYGDPVGWVRRVGWNLATSRLRRLVVASRVLGRTRTPGPSTGLSTDHVALVTALKTLPVRHRHVLVLHYFADMSVTEICADLGIPRGTALSWLHRGRAELAQLLGEDEGPSTGLESRNG